MEFVYLIPPTIRFDLQPGGAIGRSAFVGESSREYPTGDKFLIPPQAKIIDLPLEALLGEDDLPDLEGDLE